MSHFHKKSLLCKIALLVNNLRSAKESFCVYIQEDSDTHQGPPFSVTPTKAWRLEIGDVNVSVLYNMYLDTQHARRDLKMLLSGYLSSIIGCSFFSWSFVAILQR